MNVSRRSNRSNRPSSKLTEGIESHMIGTLLVRILMRSRIFPALVSLAVFVISAVPAGAQIPSPSKHWTLADYGKHDSTSFRKYAPAQQLVRRETIDYGLLEAAIFYASNEQRILHGVPAFRYSEGLRKAARLHSQDMAIFRFFAHEHPHDPTRRTPWKRMAAQGVTGGHSAENIASTSVGRQTYLAAADGIVAMWMKSPGHRRNLLNPRLRYLGCGVHSSFGDHFQLLATQNFTETANR